MKPDLCRCGHRPGVHLPLRGCAGLCNCTVYLPASQQPEPLYVASANGDSGADR